MAIFKRQSGGRIFYTDSIYHEDGRVEARDDVEKEKSDIKTEPGNPVTSSVRDDYNHFMKQYSTVEDDPSFNTPNSNVTDPYSLDPRAEGSNLYKTWSKLRGEDSIVEFNKFVKLLGTISFAETGRKNIKTKGKSSAKGYFQFTDSTVTTDKQRARNAMRDYGIESSALKNILNIGHKDVMDLDVEDQAIMALLHMHYSTTVPLNAYLKGRVDDSAVYEGWVGDIKNRVYKKDEHLVNFRDKKREIQKDNLNTNEKLITFIFGGNYDIKMKKGGILYNNNNKVEKAQTGLSTKKKVIVFAESPTREIRAKRRYSYSDFSNKNKDAPKEISQAYDQAVILREKLGNSMFSEAEDKTKFRDKHTERRDAFAKMNHAEVSREQRAAMSDEIWKPLNDEKKILSSSSLKKDWLKTERKFDSLMTSKLNPIISPGYSKRDSTFITEANNIKTFYKNNPDVSVDVIPFYKDKKMMRDKLASLKENDDVVIMGHSGEMLGGIVHDTIAKYLKASKAKNCYFGSCSFQKPIDDSFSNLKDKNIYYRPDNGWLGFNPNAKDFINGMFSRNYIPAPKGLENTVKISPAIKGKNYDIIK